MCNWPLFSWLLETCSALGARHLLGKRGRPSLWREVNSLFTWSSTQQPWGDLRGTGPTGNSTRGGCRTSPRYCCQNKHVTLPFL